MATTIMVGVGGEATCFNPSAPAARATGKVGESCGSFATAAAAGGRHHGHGHEIGNGNGQEVRLRCCWLRLGN